MWKHEEIVRALFSDLQFNSPCCPYAVNGRFGGVRKRSVRRVDRLCRIPNDLTSHVSHLQSLDLTHGISYRNAAAAPLTH
ncbi:unnamed protein product, partial [Iphiclides podalirius]